MSPRVPGNGSPRVTASRLKIDLDLVIEQRKKINALLVVIGTIMEQTPASIRTFESIKSLFFLLYHQNVSYTYRILPEYTFFEHYATLFFLFFTNNTQVHWGCVTSLILPSGWMDDLDDKNDKVDKKEEKDKKGDDDDDQDEVASTSSTYAVSKSSEADHRHDAPIFVRWYSAKVRESPSHTYERQTKRLILFHLLNDFILLLLTAFLINQIFVPGPVQPSESTTIMNMTISALLLWVISLVVLVSLRHRAISPTSCFLFSLDLLSSIGVALTLTSLLWSLITSDNADHPIFRLLPGGALKCLPLACRLDQLLIVGVFSDKKSSSTSSASASTSLWMKYIMRSTSSLFCFSWMLGNLFVVLHDREDQCSPSVLWLHAVLLLLGGGASSEDVGCLITDQSSVAKVSSIYTRAVFFVLFFLLCLLFLTIKFCFLLLSSSFFSFSPVQISVAAALVGTLHVVGFATLLIFSSNMIITKSDVVEEEEEEKEERNEKASTSAMFGKRVELLVGAVTSSWLRRRRLVLLVRSFDADSNEDELELALGKLFLFLFV